MKHALQSASRMKVSPRRAAEARSAENVRTRAVVRNCLADTLAVDLVRMDEVATNYSAKYYKWGSQLATCFWW